MATEAPAESIIITTEPSPIFPDLADRVEHAADVMSNTMMFGRPLTKHGPAADYFWYAENTRDPDMWFQRIQEAAQVIDEVATRAADSPFSFTHADWVQTFRPPGSSGELLQLVPRPEFIVKDPGFEPQPTNFTAFELLFSMSIVHGAHPEETLRDFSEHLTHAVYINPQAAWEGMTAFGIDLLLPGMPNLTIEQCDRVARSLETWNDQQPEEHDGIDFLMNTLAQEGIITIPENETTHDYWTRMAKILPRLEEYIRYDLPRGTNQRPEYYMQLCLAMAYFVRHKELRYDHVQEAISALVVKDGEILGAAYNIPTQYPHHFVHAEQRAIAQAVERTGDVTLAGTSLFVNIEPCIECGPIIRKCNFAELYMGPRTLMGADTRGGLFTVQPETEEIPSGDFLAEQGPPYFPIPAVVSFNMLYEEMTGLIVEGQKWKKFILPIQSK